MAGHFFQVFVFLLGVLGIFSDATIQRSRRSESAHNGLDGLKDTSRFAIPGSSDNSQGSSSEGSSSEGSSSEGSRSKGSEGSSSEGSSSKGSEGSSSEGSEGSSSEGSSSEGSSSERNSNAGESESTGEINNSSEGSGEEKGGDSFENLKNNETNENEDTYWKSFRISTADHDTEDSLACGNIVDRYCFDAPYKCTEIGGLLDDDWTCPESMYCCDLSGAD